MLFHLKRLRILSPRAKFSVLQFSRFTVCLRSLVLSPSAGAPDGTVPDVVGKDVANRQRRLALARVNSFLFTAERLLGSATREVAGSWIQKKLDGFEGASRGYAFEKMTTLLLRHSDIGGALQVYQWMRWEGHNPSAELGAKMGALELMMSTPDTDREEFLHSLKKAVSEESYPELSLRGLIDLVAKLDYPIAWVDELVKTYVGSRGPEYTIPLRLLCDVVELNVRKGELGIAVGWLDVHANGRERPHPAPYAVLLNALAERDPTNSSAHNAVMERMKQDNVTPDVALVNTLITRESRQHHYDKAFSLYRFLRESSTPSMIPDAFTFATLFSVHYKIARGERTGGLMRRRHKQPHNVIPLRQLYSEMLECHLAKITGRHQTHPSSVLSASVLNSALRAFMFTRDYAAAFVIVRSFKTYDILMTSETRRIIISSIIHRIRREIKSAYGEELWVDRLLGISHRQRSGISEELVFGIDTVNRLLRMTRETNFTVDVGDTSDSSLEFQGNDSKPSPLNDNPQPRQSSSSASSAPKELDVPDGDGIDALPLQRVLRRALTAEFNGVDIRPAKAASEAIREVKLSMIPQTPPGVGKGKSRDWRKSPSSKRDKPP